MTRRPQQIAALALVGLSLLAAACSREAQAPAGEKRLKLAFVTNNASNFWTIARRGTEEAEKTLGNVDVTFRMPAAGSAGEQQQLLDDLMASGVDGIAVSPVDPPTRIPSSRASRRAIINDVLSETCLNSSTQSNHTVVGILSPPIPSTL